MSRGGLGFHATVIAGVLSAIIVTFLTWLFGFWSTIWSWIVKTSATVFEWISYSIPIPVSVLVLLAGILIYILSRTPNRPIAINGNEYVPVQNEAASTPSLSANEEQIVRFLAAADGKWAGVEDVSYGLGLSQLIAEQALEKLLSRGFLSESHNYVHGTTLRLSSSGRDFAIEQGYVK